jgi:hypothetical protein
MYMIYKLKTSSQRLEGAFKNIVSHLYGLQVVQKTSSQRLEGAFKYRVSHLYDLHAQDIAKTTRGLFQIQSFTFV